MIARLLRWICDPAKLEAIEGDLAELYGSRTGWRYVADVLSVCVHQPRTELRVLLAGLVVLVLTGPSGPPLHYTVQATDPAGEFALGIRKGRAIWASMNGTPVPAANLVQTGDMLVIRGGDGGADFYIAIKPEGGISWYPRHSSSR